MIFTLFFLIFLCSVVHSTNEVVCDPKPGTPVNKPFGNAKGIFPGRVSWNYNGDACSWDGKSNYWWKSEFTDQDKVDSMLNGVVLSITGKEDLSAAWDALFKHFNKEKSGKEAGYASGEGIAVKLNLNVHIGYDTFGNANSLSPQFIKALLRQLVNSAGIPQRDIVLYDATRWIQTYFWDKPTGIGDEFPHVRLIDAEGGMDYVEQVQVDHSVDFFFSDASVQAQNISKLPKCLTHSKYLIQLDAFRGHDLAGITETGKNWFGSIYRPDNFCNFTEKSLPGHWCPISLHKYVNMSGGWKDPDQGGWLPQRPMSVYNPLVDLMGHDHTSHGKGLIFFSDGLYGGPAEQDDDFPLKFKMQPFDGNWSCSLFASLDPIALDSVLFDFLRAEPNEYYPRVGCVDNYLHEGALANDPPSKVVYAPSGRRLDSLGVHEHWNNDEKKEYSRNLGIGNGIELIKVHEK